MLILCLVGFYGVSASLFYLFPNIKNQIGCYVVNAFITKKLSHEN